MSTKSDKIAQLLGRIPLDWTPPVPIEGAPLLDHGLLCVLARHLTGPQAEKTLRALAAAFEDWNELRVSQVQEFEGLIATKSDALRRSVAGAVKEYLQDVFQKNHGFDLEFLREDLNEAGKFLQQLEYLGASAAHCLLCVSAGGHLPTSTQTIRVLDRLGVMKRTSSPRKAQADLEEVVPEGLRMEFGAKVGGVAGQWCDSKKPSCWECPLVGECPFGMKVERDWKQQQVRLEAQRKKEEERRKREEERERQKTEAEARRKAREMEKIQARKARERKQVEARRKKEKAKADAARQKEEDRKKAEAAKKAAAKKKAAKKVKKKTTKKKVTKKVTRKPAAKKKAAKKATRKPAVKKKAAKRPTRKGAAAKPTKKKTTKKVTRKPAKKVTKKKPASRKRPAAPKRKTAKRKTTKRR